MECDSGGWPLQHSNDPFNISGLFCVRFSFLFCRMILSFL